MGNPSKPYKSSPQSNGKKPCGQSMITIMNDFYIFFLTEINLTDFILWLVTLIIINNIVTTHFKDECYNKYSCMHDFNKKEEDI